MKVAIVIPLYNHAASIGRVIEEVRAAAQGVPEIAEIVLVDDGCTDGSSRIVEAIAGLTVLSHARNRGKGEALLTAFRYAAERGFTQVVTIDADGQHDPRDILRLLAVARLHPDDLIIGFRDMEAATGEEGGEVPASSKRGRDISRFWLRVETGQDIPDSQCGLRIYPLAHVLGPPHRFGRFAFETEVLARLAWGGIKIRSVPVRCIYFGKGRRVSHFRPIADTLRGVRMNVYLVARRLSPLPFPRLLGKEEGGLKFGRWWKLATWRVAIRQALQAGSSNSELASAFALGIFVGLTPFYFLQTILAIYLARRLHLNVLAAVIGSQISIPPLAPLWFLVSYGVGNLLLRGEWVNVNWQAFSRQMLPTLLLGNILVASGTAVLSLLLARQILHRVRCNPVPTC